MRRIALLAAFFAACAGCAHAPARGDRGRLVALLPLAADGAMSAAQRLVVEQSVHRASFVYLGRAGLHVLGRDLQRKVLADNGLTEEDVLRACEESCELGIAQELRARIFVGGRIARGREEYVAFVRIFDGIDGSLLGTMTLAGRSPEQLRREFEERSCRFFADSLAREGIELECTSGDETMTRREVASPRRDPALVVNAGLAGIPEGVLGASISYFPMDWLGFTAGGGFMALGAAVTLRSPSKRLYVSAAGGATWAFAERNGPAVAISAGVWDIRRGRLGIAAMKIDGRWWPFIDLVSSFARSE